MTVMHGWTKKAKFIKRKSFENSEYSGYLYNKKKEGPGMLLSEDGSIYEGNFAEDVRSGHGRLVDRYGNVWEANWENDI